MYETHIHSLWYGSFRWEYGRLATHFSSCNCINIITNCTFDNKSEYEIMAYRTIRSPFSSRLITPNFSPMLTVLFRFFLLGLYLMMYSDVYHPFWSQQPMLLKG